MNSPVIEAAFEKAYSVKNAFGSALHFSNHADGDLFPQHASQPQFLLRHKNPIQEQTTAVLAYGFGPREIAKTAAIGFDSENFHGYLNRDAGAAPVLSCQVDLHLTSLRCASSALAFRVLQLWKASHPVVLNMPTQPRPRITSLCACRTATHRGGRKWCSSRAQAHCHRRRRRQAELHHTSVSHVGCGV